MHVPQINLHTTCVNCTLLRGCTSITWLLVHNLQRDPDGMFQRSVAEKTIRRLGLYKITSLQNHPHFTSICVFEANVKNMKKHEDLRTARFWFCRPGFLDISWKLGTYVCLPMFWFCSGVSPQGFHFVEPFLGGYPLFFYKIPAPDP